MDGFEVKLLINASVLGEKATGLGVYAENCISGLTRTIKTTLISSKKIQDARVEIESPKEITLGSGRLAPLRRMAWSRKIDIEHGRLVYSPTHHGIKKHKNQIITIHDLICLKYPRQHILQYLFFKLILPKTINNCRAIFTVSETSKADISSTYKYPKEKIFVIPNGVDRKLFKEGLDIKPQEPFLLMVGARYPHKNAEEAIRNYKYWSGKYKLLIASCEGKYRKALESLVTQEGLGEKVVFLEYVSLPKLVELYQGCSALIYPSKWEGFGIPPLEALACGSPVIASSIPVHQEVLGDAAIFIDIDDPSTWEKAFNQLENPEKIKAMKAAAAMTLSKYTWENSAKALIQSLLSIEPNLERYNQKRSAPRFE